MLHYIHVSILRNDDFLLVYVHAFATLICWFCQKACYEVSDTQWHYSCPSMSVWKSDAEELCIHGLLLLPDTILTFL